VPEKCQALTYPQTNRSGQESIDPMAKPAPQVASMRLIEGLHVHALFDGGLAGTLADYHNLPAQTVATLLAVAGQEVPPRPDLTCFLIDDGRTNMLVDAGAGFDIGEGGGALFESLALLGLAPSDIDTVFLTHLHGDHVGGLTDAAGKARFRSASILSNSKELDYFRTPAAKLSARRRRQDEIIAHALSPYRGRIRGVEAGRLADLVEVRALPGHTPGHSGLMIGTGTGERLFIVGDILHLPEVQLPHPQVTTYYDWDEALAAETRHATLAEAARDNILVAGMHFRWPTFSRVCLAGDRFALEPEAPAV
jgi:glyoxylase-like metal-dependent hydrolase (beta-lactamase superfamily II)